MGCGLCCGRRWKNYDEVKKKMSGILANITGGDHKIGRVWTREEIELLREMDADEKGVWVVWVAVSPRLCLDLFFDTEKDGE